MPAALLMTALAALAPGLSLAASARRVSVHVRYLSGELTYEGEALSEGVTVRVRGPLRLSKGGEAVLEIGKGVVLLKGPASFVPSLAGGSLIQGALLSVVPNLKQIWRVRTPTVTAAVRGTSFFLEVRERSTYVCMCMGALDISPTSNSKERPRSISLKAIHHDAFEFRLKDGRLRQADAKMEHHGDEEIAFLKSLLR